MRVKNIHERRVLSDSETTFQVFESLATKKDRLWPKHAWPVIRLDAPKENLGRGGHGPIRYKVIEHKPGTRTTFVFENEKLSRGLVGVHYFELVDEGKGVFLARHVIDVDLQGLAIILWPIFIRPMHDALLEDALDNFERETTKKLINQNNYSFWVKFMRMVLIRKRKIQK